MKTKMNNYLWRKRLKTKTTTATYPDSNDVLFILVQSQWSNDALCKKWRISLKILVMWQNMIFDKNNLMSGNDIYYSNMLQWTLLHWQLMSRTIKIRRGRGRGRGRGRTFSLNVHHRMQLNVYDESFFLLQWSKVSKHAFHKYNHFKRFFFSLPNF